MTFQWTPGTKGLNFHQLKKCLVKAVLDSWLAISVIKQLANYKDTNDSLTALTKDRERAKQAYPKRINKQIFVSMDFSQILIHDLIKVNSKCKGCGGQLDQPLLLASEVKIKNDMDILRFTLCATKVDIIKFQLNVVFAFKATILIYPIGQLAGQSQTTLR